MRIPPILLRILDPDFGSGCAFPWPGCTSWAADRLRIRAGGLRIFCRRREVKVVELRLIHRPSASADSPGAAVALAPLLSPKITFCA